MKKEDYMNKQGVWHCDVELTNDLDNSYYDTAESVWSFDEVQYGLDLVCDFHFKFRIKCNATRLWRQRKGDKAYCVSGARIVLPSNRIRIHYMVDVQNRET